MSTKYVHFTDEQKEQARQTDLCELLRSQGEKLKRSGSEYEWQDGSQKVTIRGNLWFHQYDQQGGDAIDFVRRFYNKDYPEAVEYLLGGCKGTLTVSPPIDRRPPKPFELPPRNDNMRRVYAYLLSRRGLDRDVVYTFAHRQMIYESAQYHNAVFVGFDQHGIPRHANMRGTGSESTFKGNADSSIPEYSFHWTGRSKYPIMFYKNQHYGSVMLYGHVHNTREWQLVEKWKHEQWDMGIPSRLINVGCMMDYMRYTPRTLEELLDANPMPIFDRIRQNGTPVDSPSEDSCNG